MNWCHKSQRFSFFSTQKACYTKSKYSLTLGLAHNKEEKDLNFPVKTPHFGNQKQSKNEGNTYDPKNKELFMCVTCYESFSSEQELNLHLASGHKIPNENNPNQITKLKCTHCNVIFGSKVDLVKHTESLHMGKRLSYFDLNVHEGKKPFQCVACDASYVSKKGLQYHVESTHEGKKFICSLCNLAFTQKGNLMRHTKVMHDPNKIQPNEVKKPYQCLLCEMSFKSQGSMKR